MTGFGKRDTRSNRTAEEPRKSDQRMRDEKIVSNVLFYGILCLLVAITFSYFVEIVDKTIPEQATSSVKASVPETPVVEKVRPPLWVISSRCVREYGFAKIIGKVRNQSAQRIDKLMVIGLFHDTNDDLVKTASAMVEYQPLLPGQESPFTAMTTDNPAIRTCGPAFKTMFGGVIPYED